MLRVILRPDYGALVDELAERFRQPIPAASLMESAMLPEWVVSPSVGTRQWLRHELSAVLGRSGPDRHDGIVANWHHEFPGALTQRLLTPHLEAEYGVSRDPWAMPELTFRLVELVQRNRDKPYVRPLISGDGDVLMSRARHYADLFDRYHVWRPEMVLEWSRGGCSDGSDAREVEQSAIWRELRSAIALPSPPERFAAALQRASASDIPRRDAWPNPYRVSIFGLTAFPGGLQFVDAVSALSQHSDVALYLVHGFHDDTVPHLSSRVEFRSELMQMWGGLPLANAPIIQELIRRADDVDRHAFNAVPPTNFLTALQHTLRCDENLQVAEESTQPSVVEHWCHGAMRQAEVVRDAIRHDLASSQFDPPLEESEILVVCAGIKQYAPLIRTAFGQPRSEATDEGQPSLAYRIIDPRLTTEGPYLRSLRQGLELVRSRCTRSDVLAFLEAPPVATRRRLGVDDLEVLSTWTKDAAIRWGLSAEHRETFGVSGLGDINTWAAGLQRLFLGVAVENPSFRGVRELLPVEVMAGRIELVGNLTEIVTFLERAAHNAIHSHTIREWLEWFDEFVSMFLSAGLDDEAEASRVARSLGEIRQVAESVTVEISYADFLTILDESWSSVGSVSHLLSGGITVTSVDTLRWIPFRSIYIVGFDDESFTRPEWSSDDLRRRQLQPADITPNDDARSRLSELILSSGERLTILRSHRDVTNNTEVDFGIAYAEYRQAITAIGGEPLTICHPRHGFSQENFDPDSPLFADARRVLGYSGPWSFSRLDHRVDVAASASQLPEPVEIEEAVHPQTEYSLGDLVNFLRDPVGTHVRVALGIRDDSLSVDESDDLEIEIAARDKALLLRRLFDFGTRDSGDLASARRALLRSGDIPPEEFAPGAKLIELTASLTSQFEEVTFNAAAELLPIEIRLGNLMLRDTVKTYRGESELSIVHVVTSEIRARHVFQPWLEALAVRAVTPEDVPVVIELICIKDGVVATVPCPLWLSPDEALSRLVDVVKLYLLNLHRPIPYDSDIDLHETWGDFEEEEWQGEKMNRTHCYLGKPAWRLVFGEYSSTDIVEYEPSPGYSIDQVRVSVKWFLSNGVDLATPLKKAKKP